MDLVIASVEGDEGTPNNNHNNCNNLNNRNTRQPFHNSTRSTSNLSTSEMETSLPCTNSLRSSPSADTAVIAVPPQAALAATVSTVTDEATTREADSSSSPTEIPPEPPVKNGEETDGHNDNQDNDPEDDQEEDDEDYEYEYEDEDDAAFGGFLVEQAPVTVAASSSTSSSSSKPAAPAKIEEEELSTTNVPPAAAAAAAAPAPSSKWREPSREAVSMSLRAEKETTGSKRRLAQDLYRIMNKATEETGFSLKPYCEDSMNRWTIKLFQFDEDSHLAKDMLVLGMDAIELEMTFPDQYPFEPPFVRVVRPRFKRQTGFVMNGAICMELLTKDGWNPVNDIESVIVSIRSLLVVGEGRLEAAYNLSESKYNSLLESAEAFRKDKKQDSKIGVASSPSSGGSSSNHHNHDPDDDDSPVEDPAVKRQRKNSAGESQAVMRREELSEQQRRVLRDDKHGGSYSEADAWAAYEHLSNYHKKKGWDTSGWWARKG